jgi:O-antigen/teichoic acid export membrane protein
MLKNIATVLSGTLVAQLIALAAMPLLSRLYSPEDFGHFQIYMSSLNVLLMVVAFRYEVALLNADAGVKLNTLLGLVLRLSFLTSGVTAIVVWLAGPFLASQIDGFGVIAWLIAPGMLFGGLYHALIYLPIRNRNYKLSVVTKLFQSVSYVGTSLSLAFTPLSAVGLAIGDLFGRLAGGFVAIAWIKGIARMLAQPVPLIQLIRVAQEFRSFPLMTFPGTLISALTAAMIPIVFAKLYGVEVAGQYALVERFVLVPVGIIAFAVGQVFTGDFAQAIRERPEAAYPDFKRLVLALSFTGLLGAGVGFFGLPWALPIVLGSQWTLSGELAAWAMPMALSSFVAGPINMVLLVAGSNGLQLSWEICRFLIILAAFAFVLTCQLPPTSAMAIAAFASMAAYVIFLIMAQQVLSRRHRDLFRSKLK